jgi:hypothetical protein
MWVHSTDVYHQSKIFPEGKCDSYQLLKEYQHTVTKLLIYQLLTILNLKYLSQLELNNNNAFLY